ERLRSREQLPVDAGTGASPFDRDRAARPALAAKMARNAFAVRQQHGLDQLLVRDVFGKRILFAARDAAAIGFDGAKVVSARKRLQRRPPRAELALDACGVVVGKLADRGDAERMQATFGCRTDAPDFADPERTQEIVGGR